MGHIDHLSKITSNNYLSLKGYCPSFEKENNLTNLSNNNLCKCFSLKSSAMTMAQLVRAFALYADRVFESQSLEKQVETIPRPNT